MTHRILKVLYWLLGFTVAGTLISRIVEWVIWAVTIGKIPIGGI